MFIQCDQLAALLPDSSSVLAEVAATSTHVEQVCLLATSLLTAAQHMQPFTGETSSPGNQLECSSAGNQ